MPSAELIKMLAKCIHGLLPFAVGIKLASLGSVLAASLEICLRPEIELTLRAAICRLTSAVYASSSSSDVSRTSVTPNCTSSLPPSGLLMSWPVVSKLLIRHIGMVQHQDEEQTHLVCCLSTILDFEVSHAAAVHLANDVAVANSAGASGGHQASKRVRLDVPVGSAIKGGGENPAAASTSASNSPPSCPGAMHVDTPTRLPPSIEAIEAQLQATQERPLTSEIPKLYQALEAQRVALLVFGSTGQPELVMTSMVRVAHGWLQYLDQSIDTDHFQPVLHRLVNMAGIMLCFLAPAQIPMAINHTLAAICSLPWLLNKSTCKCGGGHALTLLEHMNQSIDMKKLRSSWTSVSNAIEDKVLVKCLEILPMLSSPASLEWCGVVFEHSLDSRVMVKTCALHLLPRFLAACCVHGVTKYSMEKFKQSLDKLMAAAEKAQADKEAAEEAARALDKPATRPAEGNRSVDTITPAVTALAGAIGHLACAAAGTLKPEMNAIGTLRNKHAQALPLLQYLKSTEIDTLMYPSVKCSGCSTIDEVKCKKTVSASTFQPLLALLREPYPEQTRLQAVQSLPCLLTHVPLHIVDIDAAGCASGLAPGLAFSECVTGMDDSSYNVRLALVEAVPYFHYNGVPMSRFEETLVAIFGREEGLQDGIRETCFKIIGQVGRFAKGRTLLQMIMLLISSLPSEKRLVRATAFEEIRYIAQKRNVKVFDLFQEFEKDISTNLVDLLCTRPVPTDCLAGLLEMTETVYKEEYCRSTLVYTLPHLIARFREENSAVNLAKLADMIGVTLLKLLTEEKNVVDIFSGLQLASLSTEDLRQAIDFWNQQMHGKQDFGKMLTKVLKKSTLVLMCALVLNFKQGPSPTNHDPGTTLPPLLKLEEHPMWESILQLMSITESTVGVDVQKFLGTRLMGIIHQLDAKILGRVIRGRDKETAEQKRPTINPADQKRAMQGLSGLIAIMGPKNLASVHVKVIGILSNCADKYSELHELICDAWTNFMQVVDIEVLGELLAQLAITLLRLMDSQPDKVAALFRFMVIDKRAELHKHFNDIYFVPNVPRLSEVNAILDEERGTDAHHNSLDGRLAKHVLQGLLHESTLVHQQALMRLKQLLFENHRAVNAMILSTDTFVLPELIQDILCKLMRCARHSDVQTRRLAGECLGELGAIDPGRVGMLQLTSKAPGKENMQVDYSHHSVSDATFGAVLISKYLQRAFKAAVKTEEQDRAACAIQDCLRAYGCDKELPLSGSPSASQTEVGEALWYNLEQSDRHLVYPFLSTGYRAQVVQSNEREKRPLFKHIPNKYKNKMAMFKHWIKTFMDGMVSHLKTANPDDQTVTPIFAACLGIAKDSLETSLFLLPHLILHVIWLGERAIIDEVLDEIREVLGKPADGEDSERSFARLMASQAIFSIIDHVTHWSHHAAKQKRDKGSKRRQDPETSRRLGLISGDRDKGKVGFLNELLHDTIALAAFRCQDFPRALFHLEEYARREQEQTSNVQKQGAAAAEAVVNAVEMDDIDNYLQRIYQALEDPDGMEGVAVTRAVGGASKMGSMTTPREAVIRDKEALGQWTHAVSYYELAIRTTPHSQPSLSDHLGLVKCQMMLGHLKTAVTHATGVVACHQDDKQWTSALNSKRVEAAWRLLDWEALAEYLETPSVPSFETSLGQIIASARERDAVVFKHQIDHSRDKVMSELVALGMEQASYERLYKKVLKLHMLSEIERALVPILDDAAADVQHAHDWDTRLSMVQSSYRNCEQILSLRRCVVSVIDGFGDVNGANVGLGSARAREVQSVGKAWVQSAKLARKEGLLQTSYTYILHASDMKPPSLPIEKARLLWDMNQKMEALAGLEVSLGKVEGSAANTLEHAEALLLAANWMVEVAKSTSDIIIRKYKDITKMQPDWEEGYFALAKYYESMLLEDKEAKRETIEKDCYPQIVKNYGMCLKSGSKYVFQALSRMLTIWLDYGGRPAVITDTFNKLNRNIERFIGELPAFQFLTALPQLTSRICHPNEKVFALIQSILIKLLEHYHQQTLWMMMAGKGSTQTLRSQRCTKVLKVAQQKIKPSAGLNMAEMVAVFSSLTKELLDVCNKAVPPKTSTMSMKRDFKKVWNTSWGKVMIPVTAALTLTLPNETSNQFAHKPFSEDLATIHKFEDKITLLPSLQQPRKITIIGTDGKQYIFLCKPKDDLRRDSRVMEFMSLINKLLMKDPATRRRQLKIRTYAVMPLNEECGLIEWVPNTIGFRNIVYDIYKSRGKLTRSSEIKAIMSTTRGPTKDWSQKQLFEEKLLPRFPPVFGEWFRSNFPDPTAWYNSRLAYARTAAVMSMVGFVIGLGDRHGENILFDSVTGDTVHVDFNCLFNKGEYFQTPEKVPFRLTHNMVHAMGVTGVEGTFRKTCEATMQAMKNEQGALTSVLRTFVYDPLIEWSSNRKKATKTGEVKNDEGVRVMTAIEGRLKGKAVTKQKGLPLQVEGQVDQLIQEATSNENLCQMYIGWAPYL